MLPQSLEKEPRSFLLDFSHAERAARKVHRKAQLSSDRCTCTWLPNVGLKSFLLRLIFTELTLRFATSYEYSSRSCCCRVSALDTHKNTLTLCPREFLSHDLSDSLRRHDYCDWRIHSMVDPKLFTIVFSLVLAMIQIPPASC